LEPRTDSDESGVADRIIRLEGRSSATVKWNFGSLVTAGDLDTVRLEAAEARCTSSDLDIVDYMAYSKQFGDQSGSWGFLNLCPTAGRNRLWDIFAPPADDVPDYYVRIYTFNGSNVNPQAIVLTGDRSATCTAWRFDSDGTWFAYCSIVEPRTTITGTLLPPA